MFSPLSSILSPEVHVKDGKLEMNAYLPTWAECVVSYSSLLFQGCPHKHLTRAYNDRYKCSLVYLVHSFDLLVPHFGILPFNTVLVYPEIFPSQTADNTERIAYHKGIRIWS